MALRLSVVASLLGIVVLFAVVSVSVLSSIATHSEQLRLQLLECQKLRPARIEKDPKSQETCQAVHKPNEESRIKSKDNQPNDATYNQSAKYPNKNPTEKGMEYNNKWLIVGIPTAPRPNNINYLRTTLVGLLSQIQYPTDNPLYDKIHIVVMNMNHAPHPAYDEVKEELSKSSDAHYFTFVDNNGRFNHIDIRDEARPRMDGSNQERPSFRVRQQTIDVSTLLDFVGKNSSYYLFMEDDFELCPHGMRAIHYVMEKARWLPFDWSIIRISYGLNGVIMKGPDVPIFSQYLRDNVFRRPPDHLSVEWYAKEVPAGKSHFGERRPVAFRYNLFTHLGLKSTLRDRESQPFPGCYQDLVYPTVFEVEAYDPKKCGHDDITPCDIDPSVQKYHKMMKFV